VNQSFATRGIAQPSSQSLRQDIRHRLIDELHGGVHRAANLPGAKRANRFVDRYDPADLGGIYFLAAQHFDLGIDHLQPCGSQLIDLRLAMKNEQLPGLQAPFKVSTVKKLARQRTARVVLHQQVINGVAAAHTAHRLAAHHPCTNGVRAVRLNVFHLGEMDAVFVTEREVPEQVLKRVDPALREQFGALRANAFDHAYCCAKVRGHWQRRPPSGQWQVRPYDGRRILLISFPPQTFLDAAAKRPSGSSETCLSASRIDRVRVACPKRGGFTWRETV